MRSLWLGAVCAFAMLLVGACSDGSSAGGGATDAGDRTSSSPSSGDVADIRVETIRDITFNVEGFDTYAWVAVAAAIRDPDRRWTPSGLDIMAEAKFLIDRELRERGRSQVVTEPKMVAIFGVALDMKAMDVSINPESELEEFEPSPKGGLFVFLVHPRTRYVVWAGRAIADVSEAPTIEAGKARLEYAITKMFEDFPN